MGKLQVTYDHCENCSGFIHSVCKVMANTQTGNDLFLLITEIIFSRPDEEVHKANDRASREAFNFFGCLTSTD